MVLKSSLKTSIFRDDFSIAYFANSGNIEDNEMMLPHPINTLSFGKFTIYLALNSSFDFWIRFQSALQNVG